MFYYSRTYYKAVRVGLVIGPAAIKHRRNDKITELSHNLAAYGARVHDLEQQLLQPQEQNVAGVLGNGLQKDHQQIDAGFFKKQTAMQETPTQGQRKQEITQNRVRQHFTL